jgi:hypothetical protein
MPLADVAGNTGAVLPEHSVSEFPKANVGVSIGSTVTVNVAGTKHFPGTATGVNVYTPDAWLLATAALHVPSKPSSEVVGSVGTVPPVQMVNEVPKLNLGVVVGVTVTLNTSVVAHCPADGVKV